MKKHLSALLIALSLFAVTGCGETSPMQEATGASSQQASAIDEVLGNAGIAYEMVVEAKHNQPDIALPDDAKLFNLIDDEGTAYFLVLDADYNVLYVLDDASAILVDTQV